MQYHTSELSEPLAAIITAVSQVTGRPTLRVLAPHSGQDCVAFDVPHRFVTPQGRGDTVRVGIIEQGITTSHVVNHVTAIACWTRINE